MSCACQSYFVELVHSQDKLEVPLPISDQGFQIVFRFVWVKDRPLKNVLLKQKIK